MYGCSRMQSWWPGDKDVPDSPDFMLLPRLAQNCMGTFSLRDCHFLIERAREATARVAVWRQFDIPMSYTMEASTCGCDQGPYKNNHLSTKQLLESGEGFCLALSYLISTPEVLSSQLTLDSDSGDDDDDDDDEEADSGNDSDGLAVASEWYRREASEIFLKKLPSGVEIWMMTLTLMMI
ncbi:cytosolic carboxypeptidase 1-like isoform X1 [Panulirus ornatus]|uniref:cytosolic carboxypeptidase 1-like isoform X1 n=1 Tax=Panulirus ornatus TaxID=150431 RepID=UPI003A83EE20